jgi:SNF2 family DNA or RNA helicase
MYKPKFKPYAHQTAALNKMKGRKAFALLMEMRTGKTKTILDHFGQLEDDGQVQDLLVIAPAGVYGTWETAIEDHVGEELKSRLLVHRWSAGAGKADQRKLHWFMEQTGRPRVLLMNVEALSSVNRAKDLCEQFLSQGVSMCVIDEATSIKSHSSQRTKFINSRLAPLADYRYILTGTVSPNSPLDVYSQFQFLGPKILGFSSYYAFRARYAVMKQLPIGGRQVPVVVNYRDIDELRSRLAPHSHRVRLEDCYDMTEPTYAVRHVELTDDQKRIYNELKHFATAKLAEEQFVSAQQVITQILRLHQVLCGHTVDETGERHLIAENRTNELLNLLEEYDGKAIIWCSYDNDIRKVSECLKREYGETSVARFWGGNQSTREQEEVAFKTDPACRFMVATAAAGGRGRTWDVADLTVYYSNTQDLEHREQSEARPKGVGKKRPLHYVDLMVPGTVDEKIIKALRNKINMAATISGDSWKEWVI